MATNPPTDKQRPQLNSIFARAASAAGSVIGNFQGARQTSLMRAQADYIKTVQQVSFNPGVPYSPIAPPLEASFGPRTTDYSQYENLQVEPRSGLVPFDILRQFYYACELAQIAVSIIQHEIQGLSWDIRAKVPGESDRWVKERAYAKAFWTMPDKVHDWGTWCGTAVKEAHITGQIAAFPHPTNDGSLWAVRLLDAATFKPIINLTGDIPTPDEGPAFEQVIKGWFRTQYTSDQLIYRSMNMDTESVYGHPPLETIFMHAQMFVEKNRFDVANFTDGNAPQSMLQIPGLGMNQEQKIIAWEKNMNTALQGNTEARVRMKIIPWGAKWELMRQAMFDKDFMDYLVKIIAAAYGVSTTELNWTHEVNKACYSEDTETLTDHGWKFHWEITDEDKIGTYNPENGRLEFHVPTDFVVYHHKGEMIHFTSSNTDILVTPNHRMWATVSRSMTNKEGWKIFTAEELEQRNSEFSFQTSATWDGEEMETFVLPAVERKHGANNRFPEKTAERHIRMDDWLEFLGYVISEGCIFKPSSEAYTARGKAPITRYSISMAQVDQDAADKMGRCLSSLPFGFARTTRKPSGYKGNCHDATVWQVCDKGLWTWLYENVGHRSGDKHIPEFVKSLSIRQQRIVFEAMMLGDGTISKKPNYTNMVYYTTSQRLADDVQEMCLKLGYRSWLGKGARCLRVGMTPGNPQVLRKSVYKKSGGNVKRIPYDGIAYCFEVPNHLFVTRRNGKIAIQGNTSSTQENVQYRRIIIPTAAVISSMVTYILNYHMGLPMLEHVFDVGQDVQTQKLLELYLQASQVGLIQYDEFREKLNLTARGLPLLMATKTGPVNLEAWAAGTPQNQGVSAPSGKPPATPTPIIDTPHAGGISDNDKAVVDAEEIAQYAPVVKRAVKLVDPSTVYAYLKGSYPAITIQWVKKAKWALNPAVSLEKISMARRPGGRDQDKVQGIADSLNDGKKMDPVVIVRTPDGELRLADGYHRALAVKRNGGKTIAAYVGLVSSEHGPWDEEMHAKKLNKQLRFVLTDTQEVHAQLIKRNLKEKELIEKSKHQRMMDLLVANPPKQTPTERLEQGDVHRRLTTEHETASRVRTLLVNQKRTLSQLAQEHQLV